MKLIVLSIAVSAAFFGLGCSDTSSASEIPTAEDAVAAGIGESTMVAVPRGDEVVPPEEDAGLQDGDNSANPDTVSGGGTLDDAGSSQRWSDSAEPLPEEQDTWAAPTEPEIPEPDVSFDFSLCSQPGGSINVYDVQNPDCPDHFNPEPTEAPGAYIFFTNVIVTGVFSDTIFVQEQPGGPYSGISVFLGSNYSGDFQVGDVVNVEGYYHEYFGNTQLTLEEYDKVGETNPPAPFAIVHPSHIATDGPLSEMFEGVLVVVSDVKTINTKPDCPNDFNEFLVTGDLRIDDMGVFWDAKLGDAFESIAGNLHFAFDNHKLEPRANDDIAWLGKGNVNSVSKCSEGDCQVAEAQLGTQTIIVSEFLFDPAGQDAGKEWIEVYNPGNTPVDIYGWELRDCADQAFKITAPDTTLEPGETFVLGASSDPVSNGGISVDVSYGDGFYLPNTVGSILLFDGPGASAQLVDQVRYMVFQEWDFFKTGHSLVRVFPTAKGTEAESWEMETQTYGNGDNTGTPGSY